jgi:hypothetical protein
MESALGVSAADIEIEDSRATAHTGNKPCCAHPVQNVCHVFVNWPRNLGRVV